MTDEEIAAAAAAKVLADAEAAAAEAEKNKNKPTDAEAKLLKEVMAKKADLKKLADTNAEMAAKLKAYEGIDPVKIREMVDAAAKAETAELEKRGEYDRLVAQMGEKHKSELAAEAAKTTALGEQIRALQGQIGDLSVGHVFDASKFISEELVLPSTKVRVLYGMHFEVEDGKVVGYDKPRGAAGRTKIVTSGGEPVGFESALRHLVENDPDKDNLIRSKVKPGAGSDSRGFKPANEEPKVHGSSRIALAIGAGKGPQRHGGLLTTKK